VFIYLSNEHHCVGRPYFGIVYIYLIRYTFCNIVLNWWKVMRHGCLLICRYTNALHVSKASHHSCNLLTRIDFIYNRSYLTDMTYSIYYFYDCFLSNNLLWCLLNNLLCPSCRDVIIKLINTVLIYMTLKTWITHIPFKT